MANVKISKIKARRGTDSQRKTVTFDQGELVYTTDTQRLFIGTGSDLGGRSSGAKIHDILTNYSSLTTVNAQVNDIVNVNNIFYQLTSANYANISSWANVGAKLDPILLSYNASNRITLNTGSISASYLAPSTVSSGLIIESGVLKTNLNTKSLEISASKLSIKSGGIDEREINNSALGNGLLGGSGTKLTLDVDTSNFYFDSNTLKLSSLPSSFFGAGLTYAGAVLTANVAGSDGASIINTGGTLAINDDALAGTPQWAKLAIDTYGRVTSHESSIFGSLTGNSALSGYNSTNSLSSIFNGRPSQSLSGGVPGVNLVAFAAVDSSGNVVTLSSAGFITFEGNTTTRTGQVIGRFAIPIFTY
jgi:hypothetical protein